MRSSLWRFVVVALLLLGMTTTVSAQEAQRWDGFEDGDYTNDPVWEEVVSNGDVQVQSGTVKNGGNALKFSNPSGSNGDVFLNHDRGSQDSISDGDVYQVWVRYENDEISAYGLTNVKGDKFGSDGIHIRNNLPAIELVSIDSSGSFIESSEIVSSLNNGQWYKWEIEVNPSSSSATGRVYDVNNNLLGTGSVATSGTSNIQHVFIQDDDNENNNFFADDISYSATSTGPPNTAPQVNSTSISPDPVLIGENVSYSAEVYDSDGTVSYTNLSVSYGGSTVVSDAQRTGTSPSWNDVFVPQTGNKWLNATLEVVDDKGAVTTKEINRYLEDQPPSVSVSNLNNQTYFSYSRDVSVTVSDSDSKPSEDITCSVYVDSNQYDTRTVTEGNSFTTSVESGVGSHTFKASCSDPAGNTKTKTVDFTVDAAKVEYVNSVSQVYETENQTYELDLKTGSMVNSADIQFVYDGSTEDIKTIQSNGIETLRPDFYNEVPLVSANQTTKNWNIQYDLNISDFQSSTTSTISESTSTQTQEILWSYYIESADTVPSDGDYIETEDLKHDVKLHTETKKAEVTGTTTYDRNGETSSMEKEVVQTDYTTLRGVIDVGKADGFNKSQFETSSSIDLSFNGDSRTLTTAKDTVEVHKIILTDGNTNLDTAKSLVFDVDYEEEGYDTATKLTMDLSVWKNRDEQIRRYQFEEDPAKVHEFYIYPKWATYKIRTLPYKEEKKFDLIQYFNQDKNKVRRSYFFPTVQTISDTVTTVPLKTINASETTPIDFEISNSDGDPAQNTYCRVDRKFGGGDFETVFMVKTGSEGRSQSFAEVNEIYYGFTCYQDGQVADTFSAQIMQNPMRLQLGGATVATSLDYTSEFDASCTSNTTRLECDYQSQTDKLVQAGLTVERDEVKQDIQVCDKSSPTATGKLTCTGLNTTENSYNYELVGEYPSTDTLGATGFLGTQDKPFSAAGLFMTAILFMLTTAATAFDLRVGIGSGALVFLLTSTINWIVLNPSQQATLIGAAIIAGVAVSQ